MQPTTHCLLITAPLLEGEPMSDKLYLHIGTAILHLYINDQPQQP